MWSHIGWVLSSESDWVDQQTVRELSRYPELGWLDRYHWVPPVLLAVLCLLIGGWSGLVLGFYISSILSHHATFTVKSICHLWGRRRYATGDASRNNLFVALITFGEGWHNNHHHYQSSANQGFFRWEIDVSYTLIRLLGCVVLVWDVRKPPRAKLLGEVQESSPSSSGLEPIGTPALLHAGASLATSPALAAGHRETSDQGTGAEVGATSEHRTQEFTR